MKGQIYLKNVVTLELDSYKCIGCRMCVTVCPHRVFTMREKKAVIVDKDLCMECGACSLNCPVDAINVRSGVGCAFGIIQGIIRGNEPTCDGCCNSEDSDSCIG
jgi:NAD-dependent dihydropyrimidine dehydrogenase PreA subunit